MKWHTVKYLCKEGILGLWKNRLMALASIGTIVLCLLILGMSYSVAENVNYVMHQIETEMGIIAYINEDEEEMRISEIGRKIRDTAYVTEVQYVSKEDALKNFAAAQENDALFEEFKSDNPLPASFEIKVDSIENQKAVVGELRKIPELQVEYFENETNMFLTMNKSIQMVSMVIIGCLVIIALLLITNTIKLTVYVRRKEINIMKYIGATDAFIRLPFLIEGILIGVIGCAIPTWIVYSMYRWLDEFMAGALGGFLGGLHLQPIDVIMQGLVPIFVVLGVGIGTIGSCIAIRKHLKV
ncbi:MAG: permease-like cell division protein FtsX [Cellulosilyticaceae bacterium]